MNQHRCGNPNCIVCRPGGIKDILGDSRQGTGVGGFESVLGAILAAKMMELPGRGILAGPFSLDDESNHEPDRNCKCPKCQAHFWKEDDKPRVGMKYSGNGQEPIFIYFPEHSRKVAELLEARKSLAQDETDKKLWTVFIQTGKLDCDTFSKEARNWVSEKTEPIFSALRNSSDGEARRLGEEVTTFDDLGAYLTGEKKTDNGLFNAMIEELRISDTPKTDPEELEEIVAKIDELLAKLPLDLHNATEPLETEIPISELGDVLSFWHATETAPTPGTNE